MTSNEEEVCLTVEDYGPIYNLVAEISKGDPKVIFLLLASVILAFDRKLGCPGRRPIAEIMRETLQMAEIANAEPSRSVQ